MDYLGNESVEACFGYYYERGNDLVVNRPGKLPFHCVYVAGSSSDSTLLGYVELYGLWRVVLCLSETYSGDDFTHIYAIDPIAGEGLDISVNLNLSVDEIREASRGEHWDRDIHLEAVANVFDTVREFDFDQALGRVSESVAKAAYARAGVSEDDILSDDKRREIARYAAEGMIPFIVHNLRGIDISALERARRA